MTAVLEKLELRRDMLFDNEIEANFLSRIYAPDRAVFGDDMNPTVVFRGSRMPELPNGKLNAAKKLFIDRELPEIKIWKTGRIISIKVGG